jgi:L-Ala-D/L-Glu epimerase
MTIVKGEIIPIEMPKEDPEWAFATSRETKASGFIVKVFDDTGLAGLGYAGCSAHHGSSVGGVKAALETYLSLLVGQDPFHLEKILAMMDSALRGNNQAKAAIDVAVYDLQAKKLGLPLHALLGGLVRSEIPLFRVLALKEPEKMAVNALKLVQQGYASIKVKLAGEADMDVRRVREIRIAVGEGIQLTVDANQTYTPKAAIYTLKRMEEYGVELCEQPVHAGDWEGLAEVTHAVDCMIEAHESALTLENIYNLVKGRIVDSIFLDIGQIGGLRPARAAASLCKLGNVHLRLGATGSQVLAAASLHFACSTPNVTSACQLGEFSRLLNDPVSGLKVERGRIHVPPGPGLGVSMEC